MKRILAADIGGTNSRFAAFTLEDDALHYESSVWLSSGKTESFAHLLQELQASSLPCTPRNADAIVLAVAGPIEEQRRARLPNLPWDIDLDLLPETCGCADAVLINDFLAQAYACTSPAVQATTQIREGTAVAGSPVAIMGAGTGFGHALVLELAPGVFKAVPSEGGHANFPFIGPKEQEFAAFLMAETGKDQIIGDMVVSGSGIRNLHAFFTGERIPSREATARLTQDSPVLEWFARFFGRACHDFVLKTLSLGGLYITGGVASGNPCVVQHPAFAEAFLNSTTHRHLLEKVPVRLNTNEEFGLWGAAQLGKLHLS